MSTETLARGRNKSGGSSPLIDPRLRDRRIEVARDHGRRRLRRFLALLAVLVVVGGVIALVQSPALDVDRVTVHGADRTAVAAVRQEAGIGTGIAMVSVNQKAIEERVEQLPWVDTATVRRSWPNTVTVTLTERAPVATLGEDDEARWVDADGQVLGPATRTSGLPLVVGSVPAVGDRVGPVRRDVVSTLAQLPTDLVRQVASARATERGIVLTLDDGIVVKWGGTSQPTAKADALRVLLDKADRDTIASIDVTVPLASTVTRQTEGP